MLPIAVAVATLAGLTSVPAESSALSEVLTLGEALALALRNNRGLESAAMDVDRAEQRVGAARSRRLPSLELQGMAGSTLNPIRMSFPAGAFGTYPATGPIPSQDQIVEAPRSVSGYVNASLAQPLTQLRRIGLSTKASELSRDVERENLRAERAAVVAEVRRLYYGIMQTESVLRATEDQMRVYRELDRVVGQQLVMEVALRSDALEVKARLAAEEYELSGLRADLATAKERLNFLLGRDIGRDFTVAALPETSLEEVDLKVAVARALERRPDLAQARLAIDQADVDLKLKKAEFIPEVSLALTYSSFVNVDLLPRNVAQLGLQVKWEPFDWGRRGKERAEKAIQVDQARSVARQAADRARIEVAEQFRKLQQARLLIEAERLGQEAAREQLRVVLTRHRHDASLLKDVLEAQAGATAAQTRYDRAVLTFWTAKADFQKAIGEER
jgi:outer membrane protein TolC